MIMNSSININTQEKVCIAMSKFILASILCILSYSMQKKLISAQFYGDILHVDILLFLSTFQNF